MTRQSKKKTKKKQKPGTIHARNVKEGTPFEEEMLVDILKDFKPSKDFIEVLRDLADSLAFFGRFGEGRELEKELKQLVKLGERKEYTLLQQEAIKQVSEFELLFPANDEEVDSFISIMQ